jgi:1-deoxy-D-xylulose 5-phosphate reductoisomerase
VIEGVLEEMRAAQGAAISGIDDVLSLDLEARRRAQQIVLLHSR